MSSTIAMPFSRTTVRSRFSARSISKIATVFAVTAALIIGLGGVRVPTASAAVQAGGLAVTYYRVNATHCNTQLITVYTGDSQEIASLQAAFQGNSRGNAHIQTFRNGNSLEAWTTFTNYVPAGKNCNPAVLVNNPLASTTAFDKLPEWARVVVGEVLYTAIYLAVAYAIDTAGYGFMHNRHLADGRIMWDVYHGAVSAFSGAVGGGLGIWINNYVDGVTVTSAQISGLITGAVTGALVNGVFHTVSNAWLYDAIHGTALRIIQRWPVYGVNQNPNLAHGVNLAAANAATALAHVHV